ncbi:MAG: phosphoribosylformylglycinamidine cyclo-ligase [Actinobacteria bacterium]|nr:phosphoribosylformylglycinamidine cyclo-ligase [Actinomycetota bacterium]
MEKSKDKNKDKALTGRQFFSYRNAGVDLDNAALAVEMIKKSVFSTFNSNVLNDLGSFAGLYNFDKKRFSEPVLVASTDGVGTKLLLAKQTGIYKNIGQDLVAMCINDILCCGASPLFFLDYIACGKLVPETIEMIVSSIAASCIICETALIGGETAEMPGMYRSDDIDIAGFAVGVVEKKSVINPELVKEGDEIIGIASSGLHSNGFSLVRKVIKDKKLDLDKIYDFKSTDLKGLKLGEIMMLPTALYHNILKTIYREGILLNGIAHITGGGFYENIKRIIPKELDAVINGKSWPVHEIFSFLQNMADIEDDEMYRVFNMGIGMVLITSPEYADKFKKLAIASRDNMYIIGRVEKGSGKVRIVK